MDEHGLVERARRGDDRAFAMLVRSHERSMYAAAYGIMRSEWDASDATQEAFAQAYAEIRRLRDSDKFHAWLSRILVNRCYAALRKRGKVVAMPDVPEPEAFTYVGREEGLDLMRAVQALDTDHRTVVVLRYFRDLKLDEIAKVLGCPVGTVKSRLNRALAHLGAKLEATSAEDSGGYVEVAR